MRSLGLVPAISIMMAPGPAAIPSHQSKQPCFNERGFPPPPENDAPARTHHPGCADWTKQMLIAMYTHLREAAGWHSWSSCEPASNRLPRT